MDEKKKQSVYQPPLLFSDEEMKLMRTTFGGQNNELMKLLRRIFLPTLLDPDVPEEFGSNDMWMDRDWSIIPVEEVKPIVLARQETIKWVLGSLIRLRTMSNSPEGITLAELAEKQRKDSSK